LWASAASEARQQQQRQESQQQLMDDDEDAFQEQNAEAVAVSMAAAAAAAAAYNDGNDSGANNANSQIVELPQPPTLQNLEEIADLIAAAQAMPQRESLANAIGQDECSYLLALLKLFPAAESKHDFGALATLAACIKTILLLNDSSIIEFVVNDAEIYEQVCSSLEYDPDLREKANHRWFLRERAKFRTVVPMEVSDYMDSVA
jgi:protein phosphatase-4 regulatory subunit 3